jgi:hypothetical protein
MPSKEEAVYMEAVWGLDAVIKTIELEDFVFLYLSLLLENSLVFVSSDAGLISSAM